VQRAVSEKPRWTRAVGDHLARPQGRRWDARSKGQAIQLPLGPLLRFEIEGGSLAASMPDKRFRKALSPPYSSSLELTQAHSSPGLRETRTLAGVGWNELE
jgi:hypothetical protein